MKLELKDIIYVPGAEMPFEYEMDLSDVDIYGVFPFAEKISVEGSVQNRAELLELDCKAKTRLHLLCDSCGKSFTRQLTVPVKYMLATSLENEDDDSEIILLNGTVLELDELMKDELIFAVDTKNLCREDCKGRCFKCGKDLNLGPCDCKPELDSHWSALSKLLEQND